MTDRLTCGRPAPLRHHYYAQGTARQAVEYLLAHTRLKDLFGPHGPLHLIETEPEIFHLEVARVSFRTEDKVLLGLAGALCYLAPADGFHLHDLGLLDKETRRVAVQAIVIGTGFADVGCGYWPTSKPQLVLEDGARS